MSRRAIILTVVVAALLIIGLGAWWGISRNASEQAPTPSLPDANETFPLPPAPTSTVTGAPQAATIVIGTPRGNVEVRNFYLTSPGSEEDTVIVTERDTHFISYDLSHSSFWIAVTRKPFSLLRAAAERDLLDSLGITKEDACKLKVIVGVAYGVDPAIGSRTFPLSFCAERGTINSSL